MAVETGLPILANESKFKPGSTKVSQDVVDEVLSMGQAKAVKKAVGLPPHDEFREAVTRVYPSAFKRAQNSEISKGTKTKTAAKRRTKENTSESLQETDLTDAARRRVGAPSVTGTAAQDAKFLNPVDNSQPFQVTPSPPGLPGGAGGISGAIGADRQAAGKALGTLGLAGAGAAAGGVVGGPPGALAGGAGGLLAGGLGELLSRLIGKKEPNLQAPGPMQNGVPTGMSKEELEEAVRRRFMGL